ncbi:PDZ domain-containing protein [Calycomorphotria hydatis]|nr:PDZ domain-containing protein [Calycomorphotria hydatis]
MASTLERPTVCGSLVMLLTFCCLWSTANVRADDSLLELEEQSIKAAVAAVSPSTVRIRTIGGKDRIGKSIAATGPTTGLILSSDGYIISSSYNFAAEPSSILVELFDGRQFVATHVADDGSRMLTLLKIEAEGLIPATAATKDSVRVGQSAITVGRAYQGPRPNISYGIVSALNRVWGKAIQVDAKVSPVNYGGPLIDMSGRVLGLLVPLSMDKQDETAGVEWYDSGIGFAVPLEDILKVLPRLQAGETLHRGLLGMNFKDNNRLLGEPVVGLVRIESPADHAGIKEGDRLVSINDLPIERQSQAFQALGPLYAGEEVTIRYKRGDETIDANATLVDELLPYESAYLGILPARPNGSDQTNADTGVPVRFVFPDSPAAKAELKRGDIITAIGEEQASSTDELRSILTKTKPDATVTLTVLRNGKKLKLECELTGFQSEIPSSLPNSLIAPSEDKLDVELGRFTAKVEDADREYWAYVPELYNPDAPMGLIVWLQPSELYTERSFSKEWVATLEQRGICVLAPKPMKDSGWTPEETEFVAKLINDFTAKYSVDPSRVCLLGSEQAGTFAYLLYSKHRELFTGVVMANSLPTGQMIQNDPEYPVSFLLLDAAGSPVTQLAQRLVEVFHKVKVPAVFEEYKPTETKQLPEETLQKFFRWADSLDRM